MAKGCPVAQETSKASPNPEQPAFEDLYEQWSDAVYRYLMYLVRSTPLAEDLFQETWIKALEHSGQLRKASSFRPWILRIARNLAFNRMRQRRNKVQVWAVSDLASPAEPEETEDLVESHPTSDPDPRERAIGAQRREIVGEAIAELDPATQEMLQLRYFEELTLPEIAEMLATPLGTVCTKVHRGLKAIRQRLKRRGFREIEEI
jgi:RNA polymerase sigma-70 factor, ECF subfamily